jgi:hypothetical protein
MPKNSQYLESYLSENDRRGAGNGLTVGTFLAYQLGGKAKKYADRYANALVNSLERAGAIRGKSAHGAVAWYSGPAELLEPEKALRLEGAQPN